MNDTSTPKLVTVFGGSGFLGRHIVRELAHEGWRIRVAVLRPNSAHYLKPMGRVGQIQLVKANVHDDASVEAALKHADAVINLVGVLSPWGRQNFEALHVRAAERIAKAAAKHNIARLVHVSALGASKDAPARYFQSKAEGEARVRAGFAAATIVRPSLVFGPEDDFFNRFAWLARISPVLPLIGGGRTRFQPVFVGDVAKAVAQILRDPGTAGTVFELGGPEIMTFKEVLQRVLKVTQRKRLLVPVPFVWASLKAAFLGLFPNPLLTLDQVRMLKTDNIVSGTLPGLRELGVTPSACGAILPSYLWRFRKTGEFEPVAP